MLNYQRVIIIEAPLVLRCSHADIDKYYVIHTVLHYQI